MKQYYVLRVHFSTLTFLFCITFILNYAMYYLQLLVSQPYSGCVFSHTYLAMMKLGTVMSYLK